ncbi:STY4528 family pathogenicity island replication protein [Rhodanobacter lindaniclasticus]
MAMHSASGGTGPIALSTLLDDTLRRLEPSRPTAPAPSDGFLYSGNRHESVPRVPFFDRRLTPLERNAWQVFRLQLNEDGLTAFPTYEQLRPFLTSMPCVPKASHETVARALTVLRLTRWLSLVRHRRDARTGRIQGNLYVLHDEPLSPYEAMQLDPDYLGLVSQALTHASKAVQRVGYHVLQELTEDPLLSGRVLPTRLHVLTQRMADRTWGEAESYPQDAIIHESEEGGDVPLRNEKHLPSESEVGQKPAMHAPFRNPKQDRTSVLKDRIKEVRTVPRARELQDLRLPSRFLDLKEEQQAGAMVALQQVVGAQRQAVLDEWAARCRNSTVRNPAGYLFGIIQKAIRGEFKAWASQAVAPAAAAPPPDVTAASKPASPEVAQAHLARLRALLDRS